MQRNKSQHLYESIISNIDKSLKHLLNEQGNTQTTEFDPKRICAKIIRYQDKGGYINGCRCIDRYK